MSEFPMPIHFQDATVCADVWYGEGRTSLCAEFSQQCKLLVYLTM